MAQPLLLPPRRPPPAISQLPAGTVQRSDLPSPTPPPLPPRTGVRRRAPPPPFAFEDLSAEGQSDRQKRKSSESFAKVGVTPATPQHAITGPATDNTQTLPAERSTRSSQSDLTPSTAEWSVLDNLLPASMEETLRKVNENVPAALASGPSLPHRIPSNVFSVYPLTHAQWSIYTTILVMLAYFRLHLIGLLIAALIGYLFLSQFDRPTNKVAVDETPKEQKGNGPQVNAGMEAVGWVNHAMYALFPLISTDVLIPFVDLMEDALAEQVPSIVTSVRLGSPALGSQPILLTSLVPLSDEEWFASLSPSSADPKPAKGHRRAKSSSSKLPVPPSAAPQESTSSPSHMRSRRTPSSSSAPLTSDWENSPSSPSSLADADDLSSAVHSRRKRDRLLHKITHRVPQHHTGHRLRTPASAGVDASQLPDVPVDGNDGPEEGEEGGDDHEDEGRYVNFQVGFEYKRNEEAMKKGKGLHCLAYMGIGLKGLGKTEIPIYIDVLGVKGTLNLRLLLSPTPPFVRTGTFSLPSMPDFDISAHPLKKGAFNAMNLPLMKPYVNASVRDVLSSFLRPHCYTMDIDRLLLGSPSSLRTDSVGVLHIVLHFATDLPKADAMGSCDPYLEVGFEKIKKPSFSTRTIGKTRDPVWEEECFILVPAGAIEAGEVFRIRANDADRFSADDSLGAVRVDLAALIASSTEMQHRTDAFAADRPGMRASGILQWSVQFCPLWKILPEEMEKRLAKETEERAKADPPPSLESPWLTFMKSLIPGEEEWERERSNRREKTRMWFNGENNREIWEAEAGASEDRLAGVLQFHVHQCIDLEIEPSSGSYGSHPRQAGGGPPALSHITDRTATENPDPPSAYCVVHLNDKSVFKTRTKEVTPMPYFNAVSERFVRDWTKAKIVFVVRDERDREHDPILGLVELDLASLLTSTSQLTRWYPLVGGLGWGRIRISLLWKSLDIQLPRGVSGYEVGTIRLKSLVFTPVENDFDSLGATIHTDSDKRQVGLIKTEGGGVDGVVGSPASSSSRRVSLGGLSISQMGYSSSSAYTLPHDHHPTSAFLYRHSCSLHISLTTRRSFGKKKLVGVGLLRLGDVSDGEGSRRIGVWAGAKGEEGDWELDFEGEADTPLDTPITPSTPPTPSTPKSPSLKRAKSSTSRLSRSSISSPSDKRLVGYIELSWVLFHGVSRAHKGLAKRNLRFAGVYEAWEAAREADHGNLAMEVEAGMDNDQDGSESEGEDEYDGDMVGDSSLGNNSIDEMSERRAHSHALHKRHKGIFQLKIARTGRYVKDKLGAKVYSATSGGGNGVRQGYGRERGTDVEIEKEGLSKF